MQAGQDRSHHADDAFAPFVHGNIVAPFAFTSPLDRSTLILLARERVKDQPYIPKFYLKGFTDKKGKVWVREKFKPMRASLPKDIAHRPDYYTHENDGKRDETAEQILMESESRAATIIRKVARSRTSHYVPTPHEVAQLMMFVAFMFTRVPVWRDFLNDIAVNIAKKNLLSLASDKERFYQSCIEFEKKEGKPLGIDFEEMRQIALNDGIGLRQGFGFNLRAMFDSAADIAKELARMGWQVLYAPHAPPSKSFVTSDSPVFTLVPDGHGQATIGVGFGWDDTEVYFPLNKRASFFLSSSCTEVVPRARGLMSPLHANFTLSSP